MFSANLPVTCLSGSYFPGNNTIFICSLLEGIPFFRFKVIERMTNKPEILALGEFDCYSICVLVQSDVIVPWGLIIAISNPPAFVSSSIQGYLTSVGIIITFIE